MTRGKPGQNRAHKGISAPGSVDGLNRNWRNTIDIITIDDYRPIPAKRNSNVPFSPPVFAILRQHTALNIENRTPTTG